MPALPARILAARPDILGMRRALSDRLLPLLVAAMVFLAALALAGALAAAALATHWNTGAAAMLTVTIPAPLISHRSPPADTGKIIAPDNSGAAISAVGTILLNSPAIASARILPPAEIAELLKPWLGEDPANLSLPLPTMVEIRLKPGARDPTLQARLTQAAPGTLVERSGEWLTRLAALIRSLQACAALALLVVTFVAAAVVGVATRAGLAARRDAIEIVHGLGATDRLIANQFARRVTILVLSGAVLGLVFAVPVLLGLASLAAPFQSAAQPTPTPVTIGILNTLPPLMWAMLASLPIAAGLIGWATAQATVRGWLRRLP